jgi:hypothetical protein
MDSDTASSLATEARNAYRAASRPPLPTGWCAVAGLCAAAGVALVGQASATAWVHVATLVIGLLALTAAALVPATLRRRQGLRGYRGPVRTENTTFGLCAVSLVVCGLDATPLLSVVYLGLGAAAGLTYFATLRGTFASCA